MSDPGVDWVSTATVNRCFFFFLFLNGMLSSSANILQVLDCHLIRSLALSMRIPFTELKKASQGKINLLI